MAEASWFWGGRTVGDATIAPYDDDEFASYITTLINYDRWNNCVLFTTLYNNLQVTNPAGLTLRVSAGKAIVNGRLYVSDADIDLTPTLDGSYSVVVGADITAQTVRTYLRSSGVTQNAALFEVLLANVTISGGAITVLTDERRFAQEGTGLYLLRRYVVPTGGGYANFLSIPAQFSALRIEIYGQSMESDTIFDAVAIQFNGDTGNNYRTVSWIRDDNAELFAEYDDGANIDRLLTGGVPYAGNDANAAGSSVIDILGYSSTAWNKTVTAFSCGNDLTISGGQWIMHDTGIWESTAAINSVKVFTNSHASGYFTAGTIISLYGKI